MTKLTSNQVQCSGCGKIHARDLIMQTALKLDVEELFGILDDQEDTAHGLTCGKWTFVESKGWQAAAEEGIFEVIRCPKCPSEGKIIKELKFVLQENLGRESGIPDSCELVTLQFPYGFRVTFGHLTEITENLKRELASILTNGGWAQTLEEYEAEHNDMENHLEKDESEKPQG